MSTLETKSIKQKVINNVTQPLYIGGIQPNHSDANIYIGSDNIIYMPSLNITSVELSYLNGVTGNIQSQLDTKTSSVSPTFTGTVSLPSTTNLNGSNLQTQINTKASTGKAIAMSMVFG